MRSPLYFCICYCSYATMSFSVFILCDFQFFKRWPAIFFFASSIALSFMSIFLNILESHFLGYKDKETNCLHFCIPHHGLPNCPITPLCLKAHCDLVIILSMYLNVTPYRCSGSISGQGSLLSFPARLLLSFCSILKVTF